MEDWDDLRVALAIARHRNLTAAGKSLGLNQSTVGRRLTQLEQRVGRPLFERTAQGFVPSEAGLRVVAAAERLSGIVTELEAELEGAATPLEGQLRITAPQLLIAPFLAARVARFASNHPGLAIELVSDERPPALSRRETDLALRFSVPDQPELFVRRLGLIAFAVYAAPAYIVARSVDPEEMRAPQPGVFAGLDAIGPPEELSTTPEGQWFARLARGARPALRADTSAAQISAVKAGHGVALLPCFMAEGERLTRLTAPTACPTRELWLAVHRDLRHTPRLRAAIAYLSDVVRTERAALMGIVG